MSPDPVDGSPENPQSWNRYTYVHNNPLTATDPTGMCSDDDPSDCPVFGGWFWENIDPGSGSLDGGFLGWGGSFNGIGGYPFGAGFVPPFPTALGLATLTPRGARVNGGFVSSFSGSPATAAGGGGSEIDTRSYAIALNRCAQKKSDAWYGHVIGNNKTSQAVLGNSISALTGLATGPERGQSLFNTAISGPIRVDAVDLAFNAGKNIPVGSGELSIYSKSIGEGQFATIVEEGSVLAKSTPLGARLFNFGANVLDGKILVDGATYLAAEVSCGLGY